MRLLYIFLLLFGIPILEIAVLIAIGEQVGIWITLALIVITAIIGSILLRMQGIVLFSRIRQDLNTGHIPAYDLIRGVILLIAGLMLLTPGFITDFLGFILFLPLVQKAVWLILKRYISTHIIAEGPLNTTTSKKYRETITLDPEEFSVQDSSSPWADREK